MPVKQAYQEFLDETIKNLHQGQRLDVQTILCQVFESLMESERAVFLNESLDNKGNGFYSRFINHLQGRFEIKIPRAGVVSFIHWLWKSSSKIAPVWISWHCRYIA
ncbi:hypothetical protein [uncultured Nitrosomonas sp.]|uniref:hypothetical protein n=1 Tax=uncultured Nitrosomonas sp. TaxID=156424 RepID=UPI0025FE52C4|nr:hypothetical protein [uncultured Nitrosomonas sp.]